MRTHPDIGLVIADLLQLSRFWLCSQISVNPVQPVWNWISFATTFIGSFIIKNLYIILLYLTLIFKEIYFFPLFYIIK